MEASPPTPSRPAALRWFEVVFVAAMAFYMVLPVVTRDLAGEPYVSDSVSIIGTIVVAQIFAMVLVSRRRQGWARWLVILLLIADVPLYMAVLPESALSDGTFWGLSLSQFALHFVAVLLLFMPSTSDWLRGAATD